MARKMKLCPYCKGRHYSQKAYTRCKGRNKVERWAK